MPLNSFSIKRTYLSLSVDPSLDLPGITSVHSNLSTFADFFIFFFFSTCILFFYLVKCLFCVLKQGFCIALITPFSGTPWSGIWWLSVTFQGITCEGKEILNLTSLGLYMILYNFFLICLDFFFFSFVSGI